MNALSPVPANALAPIPTGEARLPVHTLNRVYFIQSAGSGLVKIGFTRDIEKRFSALQTGSGNRLLLLRYIDGGLRTERWLHRHYASNRVRGEWFKFCETMLTIVPPDELPEVKQITIRRDVRLSLRERLNDALSLGTDICLSNSQVLTILCTKLRDDEAASVLALLERHFSNHADALETEGIPQGEQAA